MHQNILYSIREFVLKHQKILIILAIVLTTVCLFSFAAQDKSDDGVTVEQVKLKVMDKDSIILVDVRTVSEFTGSIGHIPGAILVPLSELESRMNELEGYKETEMIVICLSGYRSAKATRLLKDNGFNAFNMKGGMVAWNKMITTTKNDSIGEMNGTIAE
jgi:rhodanese-related sulfurtransferase